MRIIVISDTHNDFFRFKEAVDRPMGADLYVFLGDGYREFEDISALYPEKKFLSVRGNCDLGCTAQVSAELMVGEVKIFYTHGHFYDVKYGLDNLVRASERRGASIVLFGHTHVAYQNYRNGLYLLNPGSLGLPRNGKHSFGVVDITPQGIITNLVYCD